MLLVLQSLLQNVSHSNLKSLLGLIVPCAFCRHFIHIKGYLEALV